MHDSDPRHPHATLPLPLPRALTLSPTQASEARRAQAELTALNRKFKQLTADGESNREAHKEV